MADMKNLATQVRELEEQLVTCIRCGMCQAVCPLFEQTRREADVARGKLALLTGLMENVFTDPDGVTERLNRCLLCGSCAANCPSGVNVVEIFIKARAILTEYKGLSPVRQMVFRKILAHPGRFDTLLEWAEKFQRLFIRPDDNAQGTSCARLLSPLLSHRRFAPLATMPFHKTLPLSRTVPGSSGMRVALFTGCLIDKIFPSVAHASITVLSHHNVSVTIPEHQGCCGIPALAAGDRDSFTRLVQHNLSLFDPDSCDALVTACATCTATIKKLWPSLFRSADAATAEKLAALSAKTMDISEFLVDRAGVLPLTGPDTEPVGVTYHDPCHLKKSLGVAAQPRAVIQAAGYRLTEMAGSDKCCGMGGSFNLYHYDLSSAIGTLKEKNIEDTGCTIVSTGCPACMMQISDMLGKAGSSVRVRHPMELYAAALAPHK